MMEGHSPFGCPTVLGELAYVAEGSLFLLGGGDVGSFPPDCTYPPCANFSVVHATVMVAVLLLCTAGEGAEGELGL